MPMLVPPAVPAGRLTSRPQPTLVGHRLTLRPWDRADAPVLVEAYADPAIQRWHVRSMTQLDEALDWLAERSHRWAHAVGAEWAIAADGAVVGRIGLRSLDLAEGCGEVAYWVLPAARGSAVAARALVVLESWCFGEVGLQRLELAHSTLNTASCRVAEKAGYVAEGTKRQQGLHADGWHDMHLHARVRGDLGAATIALHGVDD